jgi:hypothetical protein
VAIIAIASVVGDSFDREGNKISKNRYTLLDFLLIKGVFSIKRE